MRSYAIQVRISQLHRGGWPARTVRCLFVDAPRVPFILGRADFLDRFVLTIDPAQRRIILTELP